MHQSTPLSKRNDHISQGSDILEVCTKLTPMTLLLLRAKELFQALNVIHVIFLPSWRTEDRRGSTVPWPQAGGLHWTQATRVGRGAGGWTVVQHLNRWISMFFSSYYSTFLKGNKKNKSTNSNITSQWHKNVHTLCQRPQTEKSVLHCLVRMGCSEMGCTQTRSWERTLGWCWVVLQG